MIKVKGSDKIRSSSGLKDELHWLKRRQYSGLNDSGSKSTPNIIKFSFTKSFLGLVMYEKAKVPGNLL